MQRSIQIKPRVIAVHLILWMVYVVSEYLANLFHMQNEDIWPFLRTTMLSLPLLMVPTYFIALYAVPQFLKKKKMPLFIAIILGVGAFVFFARIKWTEWINYLEHDMYYKVPPSKVMKNVIRDYSIIALAVCIYIIGDWRNKQKQNEELIKAKAETEIKLLKGQLHPHFLFNSLNNIYSLALMKSDLTADSILRLTELLDYLVYKANMNKVPLAKEVQLLSNYIELEQLRYGEKLKVDIKKNILNDKVMVAPLILLPFAENCFKHGGVGKNGRFWIEVNLEVDERNLAFAIKNSKKLRKGKGNNVGGIGLQNIRERLNLLYPGRHNLRIEDREESYHVELNLNLKDENL